MMTLEDFISRFEKPKRTSNGGYVCRCPAHDDNTASLSVSQSDTGKLLINCFANCATEDILGRVGLKFSDLMPPKEERKAEKARSIGPVIEAYDYEDENGILVFQVTRHHPKTFLQRRPHPVNGWESNLNGVVKVLYRLPALLAGIQRGDNVYLVEGEKDVHTLESWGLTATTNAGGAQAWGNNPRYIETLKDAKLYLIPDNDKAGRLWVDKVKATLPHAKVINLPDIAEKGDVSDWASQGGTREKLEQLIATIEAGEAATKVDAIAHTQSGNDVLARRYYRALGYNQKRYYFLPASTMQVAFYSAPELAMRANLYTIAPREYWENAPEFEDCENTKGGKDYSAIADVLIQQCNQAGIYNNDLRRGKGAWIDVGRTVLHSGKSLTVDGVQTRLLDLDSRYIYEARSGDGLHESAPLSDKDAQGFAALCAMPHWETPLYGQLLAGWVALAPICGTLKWRPHIWLNGPAGCGKTYIAQNLVGAALRGVVLQFAASTTEAGIRQKLASDALPVLFDEAEGDTRSARENLTKILELMRHSSSDSDAHITKGSAGGVSTDFAIRSMFCMASIAHGINRRADESRTSVLSLKAPIKGEAAKAHFALLADTVAEVCGNGLGAAMVGRACLMASEIRGNAETFAKALAGLRGGRRFGDQLGTLLAGYHSLMVPGAWSVADAIEYVEGLDLDALTPPDNDRGVDEMQCLDYLLQQIIRVEMGGAPSQMTIAECITAVCELQSKDNGAEHKALNRIGIKVIDGGLAVAFSCTHDGLARIFAQSQWAGQWGVYLRRIEGAQSGNNGIRFAGSLSRFVALPATAVL
jgi:putative DNA primase/helicase